MKNSKKYTDKSSLLASQRKESRDVGVIFDHEEANRRRIAGRKTLKQKMFSRLEKANYELLDNNHENHINDWYLYNFFKYGVNGLLSSSDSKLKEYVEKQSNAAKQALLLFSAKLINIVGAKTIQEVVETNKEVREALYGSYIVVEDALEPNCLNVSDLLSEQEILVNRLVNAAKVAKKANKKFDPSSYLEGYELYDKNKHSDPVAHLQKHFGHILGKGGVTKGVIQYIDQPLYNSLQYGYQEKFDLLVGLAGKKSVAKAQGMSIKSKKKTNKISNLKRSSYR